MRPVLDDRDREIIARNMAALDLIEGPRVGDFVRFSDGVTRRISYLWPDTGAQTSEEGSYHLGEGFVSMSGTLYRSVPLETLTRTDETADGMIWIFHHDYAQAHSAVHMAVSFRVFTCTEDSRRY